MGSGLGLFLLPNRNPSTLPPAAATVDDGRFTYAVSLFDDGQARHYDFADAESSTTIKYFILKR